MSATVQTTQIPPLRAVRQARGLGLREVAARADIDVAQLSRVERGQSGLSVESLFRLSRVLKLDELERLDCPVRARSGKAEDEQSRRVIGPSDRSPERQRPRGRSEAGVTTSDGGNAR